MASIVTVSEYWGAMARRTERARRWEKAGEKYKGMEDCKREKNEGDLIYQVGATSKRFHFF